ncbi:Gfo/Idh/MocA family oxidoreductase [Magnetospirillum fulvum]|uniref:Uncharacterized protein n=1 Tax=Magnetospirillum fulvum MGU-K5 TaxID=1316936 RepID=S9S7G2_MAGFU|nr:Gfo/Idh/MocA family oxidoreductase [Magnetospirillum fulvum]EPY01842.1 hypothetical protein K678_09006 [Magnetospirillum fulvum MGU-K5]
MSPARPKPRRVVVAGTAFGRIYLDAIASAPDEFTLAGIVARGSEESRRHATERGVPLYTSVAAVPNDIDLACVVVRSGVTGGAGAELAQALLRRGIPVLQEHPVHVAEITAGLQAARLGDTAYAVNTLHPNLRAVRQFLAAAAHLRRHHPPRFLDAACNSQLAYPLLDILGRAVGGLRPWSFHDAPLRPAPMAPFLTLAGTVGGVPLTLRVQNQVHPDDPDNHSFVLYRVALGCDAGVLTLADLQGPVLWTPRLHAPRDATGRLRMNGPGTERLAVASTSILGGETPASFHQMFAQTWPEAVLVALRGLARAVDDQAARQREGSWALDVSMAWRDLTGRIGLPEIIRPTEPMPLALDELEAAVRAAE